MSVLNDVVRRGVEVTARGVEVALSLPRIALALERLADTSDDIRRVVNGLDKEDIDVARETRVADEESREVEAAARQHARPQAPQ